MPYYCWNCERKFDEPIRRKSTQGRMFGVAFYDEPAFDEELCPFCKSDEITEDKEDEE